MPLAILFYFLHAQHVSDINISVIRSLRLCCWITTTHIHIKKYINNAPNYQSANETYYTQENTMTTKHKRKRSISMKIHLPTTTQWRSTSHQTHTTKHHKYTLKPKFSVFTGHNNRCGNSTAKSQDVMMDIWMSETCWVYKVTLQYFWHSFLLILRTSNLFC